MSDETTVLLVKGAALPDGLQAQLEAKGVFVEEAAPSHLEASLIAVAPDLILVFGVEPLDRVVATLAAEKSSVPIVVVADRQAHRELRQKYKEALGTIVPTDLPHSALSHRIATMSRRASKGEALLQTMSLAPPKATSPAKAAPPVGAVAAPALAAGPPAATQPAVTSAVAQPAVTSAVAKPAVTSAVAKPAVTVAAAKPALVTPAPAVAANVAGAGKGPLGPTAAKASAAVSRSAPTPEKTTAQKDAAAKDAGPLVSAKRFSSTTTGARPDRSGLQPKPAASKEPLATTTAESRDEAASMRAPVIEAPVPPISEARGLPNHFGEEHPTAAFQLPFEMRHKARRDSLPPETVRQSSPDGQSARLVDQEVLVAQEIEARQRLSSGGDEPSAPPTQADQRRAAEADERARSHRREHATASAVRLVLCDDDLTRADALASEMREHGLDVMLLSPEHSQVRWARLRRFAPHGLLVDERSLSKGGRQIVSAFRRDPFLKYVPLVVVPFQRIYRESEARANLAPVFPLLSPLGREELGLLEQLAQKGEIVVELSQVLPTRLVEVLAENAATCVLSTGGAGRRLTWPIAAGRAGKAELTQGEGSPGTSLKAEDALRFLLEQDEAQVLVALRPQIHLTASEPIGPLLDRVTTSIDPPLQYSIAPGKAPSVPPMDAPARTQGVKHTLLGVAPPAQGVVDPGPGGLPTIPAPPGMTGPDFVRLAEREHRLPTGLGPADASAGAKAATRGPSSSSGLRGAIEKLRALVSPLLSRVLASLAAKRRVWPAPVYWAVVLAPVLLLVLLFALWLASDSADEPAPSALAPGAPANPEASAAAAVAPQAAAPLFDRFRVVAEQPTTSCEELLGQLPMAASNWDASTFWKAARQALMQGNVERAHEMMCRAVAKDPASPAAEGLAAFYLGRRALAPADRYVAGVLAVDAERRTALELQSDVRNQQGRVDEALSILLGTVRLEPSDDVRRAVVSRKFSADAELAIKSGDLPMAERLLRRAVVLSPQNDQASLRLAEVFLRVGLRDAAKAWAELLLAGPSKHAEAHMILGDVARLAGDAAAARSHYEKVTPESGQYARAQSQLKGLP